MRVGGDCEVGEWACLLIRIAWKASKISIHLPLSLRINISSVENHCIHCEPMPHVGVICVEKEKKMEIFWSDFCIPQGNMGRGSNIVVIK